MIEGLQIKVCGITLIEQAQALEELGVQYIGFIFYAPSKRYVLNKLNVETLLNFRPKHAKKVGVFVNESLENIIAIADSTGLDIIQLHGDETPEYCAALSVHYSVIKVFRVSDKAPDFSAYLNCVDFFLLDTDSILYGGTGNHFNWDLIKGIDIPKPFFMSGGIGINDVGGIEVLAKTKAGKNMLALDVNSQFEDSPGIKNLEKIKTFIHAIV
jgi:phosphoribosylanthranilate isomerase